MGYDRTIRYQGLCGTLVIGIAILSLCHAQVQDSSWHVVIVGGIVRDAEVEPAQARTITGLSSFFIDQLGVNPGAVKVLCDRESRVFDVNTIACTRENLKKTLGDFTSSAEPIDRLVFYYIGQANRAAEKLRLNVRGKDIVHEELIQWLGAIQARQKLIILDCPCAGLAIKGLADPNSLVVCSARGDQYDSPRFSEYFVPALTQWESDEDGQLSLLDAFQTTCRDLDTYYAGENCYKSENALLEDDGDGVPSQQPWLFEQSGKDGAQAARFYFKEARVVQPARGQ